MTSRSRTTVLAGLTALAAAAVAAARRNPRAVRDGVRSFNRSLLNPVMLRYAGHGSFYASVIRHTGRRSGRGYATPVVADPVEAGFVVPLPYGPDTDWCRNVLAAGEATVERHGVTTRVTDPRVIAGAEALRLLPPPRRRAYRLVRGGQFLRVRTAA